jgi:hypothetical protein
MVHTFVTPFLRDCAVTSHDFPDFPVLYGAGDPDGNIDIEAFQEGRGLRKLWRNFPTATERVGDSSLGAQTQLCSASTLGAPTN